MHSSHRVRWMLLTPCGLLLAGCAWFEPPQSPSVVVQPPATVQREPVVVREPVIVRETPPPPETITVAPSPQHTWVPGYWTQREGDWAWQSGRWELRP